MRGTQTKTGDAMMTKSERKEANLKASVCDILSATPGGLLCGWKEISRYCRKAPRTLNRYRQLAGFPALRWGRHIYADTKMISAWLHMYAEDRARLKWQSGLEKFSEEELRAMVQTLQNQLEIIGK